MDSFNLVAMIRIAWLSILFLFACLTSNGQASLRIYSDIPGGEIYDILPTDEGYVWVLTPSGLFHFDGYTYHQQILPDSANLGLNQKCTKIEPADSNSFWLYSIDIGLHHYNQKTGKIKSYLHVPGDSNTLSTNSVMFVKQIENELWVGLDRKGLNIIDLETDQIRKVSFYEDGLIAEYLARLNLIQDIVLEPNDSNIIWILAAKGIIKFNKTTKAYKIYHPFEDLSQFERDSFTQLWRDNDGSLWVGVWGAGMYHFYPETEQWENFLYQDVPKLNGSKNVVRQIEYKDEYALWICTNDLGLGTFDKRTQTFHFLPESPKDPRSKENVPCLDIKQDAKGNNWLRYHNRLGFMPKDKPLFPFVPMDTLITKPSRYFMITDAIYFKHQFLLASFHGDGVYIPKGDDQYEIIRPVNWPKDRDVRITKFLVHNDSLFAFAKGYFLHVDLEKRQLYPYPNLLEEGSYRRPFLTRNGEFYFGSRWKGLFKIDIHSGKYENIPINEHYKAFYTGDIEEDSRGRLWIAHDNGITLYSPTQQTSTQITLEDTVFNDIRFINTSDIARLPNQYYLVGSHKGGLAMIHEDSITHRAFHSLNHVLKDNSNKILSIEVDKDGIIWVLTSESLVLLNPNLTYKQSFHVSDGLLQSDQLWKIRMFDSDSVLLCSRFGALIVNKNHLLQPDSDAQLYVSQIKVMNEAMDTLTHSNLIENIDLNYDQNFLSFTISSIHFANPKKNQTRWKLEGIDPGWNHGEGTTQATYTALPPGEYDLIIEGANRLGEWSINQKRIHVSIRPPFWVTWWFRSAIVLLVVLFIFSLYQYRIRQIKKREKLKHEFEQALTEMEIKALRVQMNPHFLFNSLNSIKHFLIQGDIKSGVRYINKFSRLLRLILNQSQLNEISIEQELQFLKLYLEIESMRFDQSFTWKINTPSDLELNKFCIPPLSIQPFVENAIWHGLMHKEGVRLLTISISQTSDHIKISVEDNGIGREKAKSIKSKSATKEKSYGVDLSKQRLELSSLDQNNTSPLEIIDLTDSNGKPKGTLINITLLKKTMTHVESPNN